MTSGELQLKIKAYDPSADVSLVEDAYRFSADVHQGQKRMSGEDYFTHPVAVAGILADMKLDVASIVTGLLHDTVEDTLTTSEEISARFGAEVAALVDGVTKISRLESDRRERIQAESLRKMFMAGARDIRVLLVKLADRYHNIRTIQHLPEQRRMRIAQETLDLYVPLAHRVGIHWLKNEYEELAFRALDPKSYREIREKLRVHEVERGGYMEEISGLLRKRLLDAGIEAEVSGRLKSTYSIFRKMNEQGLHHDEIYDVVAFRLIVGGERDCYDALGVVHMYWQPVPGRFRDYVALPKANMYQSLHTTVIGPYGERMEIQIRTHLMHHVAEFGIAAHWKYKAAGEEDEESATRLAWLNQMLDWQRHVDDPREFLANLKEDLFTEEVYVFTPAGDTHSFPQGSTVVDFAYRIHSDLGHHCAGGRVNGKLVAGRYVLQQGETVEVLTTDDQTPQREWLRFVATPRARQRIAGWLKHEEKDRAIALGRQILERDLAQYHLGIARLNREGRMAELLKTFRKDDENALLEAIGYGRLVPRRVLEAVVPAEKLKAASVGGKRRFGRIFNMISRQRKPGVIVEGTEGEVVRLAKCCQPLPGEPVTGVLTRGRGVTVHALTCSRIEGVDPFRRVDVSWEKRARLARMVKIEVRSRDRPGILAAMSQAIASAGVNIERAQVRSASDGSASNLFEMSLETLDEFNQVVRNLRRIPGVKDVRRVRS